jgi:hypothetical protein
MVDVNITGAMPYDLAATAPGAKQKLVAIRRK